jgi:hypothetical protein
MLSMELKTSMVSMELKIRDFLYADEEKPEPKTILDRATATGIKQALVETGFFDDRKPKRKARPRKQR